MRHLLLLAAVCAAALCVGLGATGLTDEREARGAQVARELIEEHEVLTPILGREPLFEKPIVGYLPEVTAALLPGPTDVRSRQIRAVLALLLVVLTASVAAEHFGARAGWWSGLALASMFGLPLAARTDGTQLMATLFAWVGVAAFADALFGRRAGRDARLVVGYGALASALVAAGPLPALWPFGALALYLALARTSGWGRVRPLAGGVLMLGLALPWYAAMFERHGLTFLRHALVYPYGEGAPGPWYAGPMLALSFLVVAGFPWTTLLPGAIRHAAVRWRLPRPGALRGRAVGRRAESAAPPPVDAVARESLDAAAPLARERREEATAHFIVACLAVSLVPIAFYPGPPLPAALPALPAIAILCGRLIDHVFEDAERIAAAVGRAALMLAVTGTLAGVMLVVLSGRIREAAPDLRALGALVFVTSWLPFLANFIGRRRLALVFMLLPVAAATPLVTLRVLPAMEGYLSARAVAAAMTTAAPPHAALVVAGTPPPSLRLYTTHHLVPGTPLAATLEAERASDGLAYVAFAPRDEREVAHAAPGPLEILMRTPRIVLARVHRG